jgi:hypothetical protein
MKQRFTVLQWKSCRENSTFVVWSGRKFVGSSRQISKTTFGILGHFHLSSSQPFSLRPFVIFYSYLILGLTNDRFPIKIFIHLPIWSTFPTRCNLLYFIILTILGDSLVIIILEWNLGKCRSQWSRGLRHVLSSAARTLGSQFRNLFGAWMYVRVIPCCVVLCR